MEPYTAPPGEAWRLGRGPLIFSGFPPLCTGEIELLNDSDQKVKVRAIPAADRDKAPTLGASELRVGASLAPRERKRVPAHFFVEPHTPPGSYTVELSCGSQSETAVVHVFEQLAVQLEPDLIRVRGAGGDVVEALVVVTNRGNVSENLRDLALVFLEEQNWVGRSMVHALRETTAEEGHQSYLDRVVRELRSSIARPARVNLRGEISEIQPGERRELRLEIKLPDELIKGRTYEGSTAFMSGELSFEVECNGSSNSTKRRPR
jgi:hypothetical protein